MSRAEQVWEFIKKRGCATVADIRAGTMVNGNQLAPVLKAILAEREAAQRLRDAVLHHFGTEGVKQWKNIADAIAAFDKETQNQVTAAAKGE